MPWLDHKFDLAQRCFFLYSQRDLKRSSKTQYNYSHCLKWQIKKAYSAQCWSSHICLTTWHHLFLEFWLVQCSVVVSTNGRFFDVVVPNAYYIKLLIALQVVTLRFGRASRSFKKRDTSTLKNSAETKYKQNKKLHLQQNNKSW